jgi:hypothetical protein
MPSLQCTSCGAPVEIRNRFSKVFVCAYCGTHLRVTDSGLDITGKHPKLAEFPSILSVGCRGTILGKPFTALGRMRYDYGGGHFDEWFLDHDGATAWLSEDEGTFALYTEMEEAEKFPDVASVRAGQTVTVDGRKVMIKEKGKARIAGGEGELSFYVEPGTEVVYIDGISEGKKISIECTEDEIELFTGRVVLKKDITVEG